jgi:hypothetical protein
MSIYTTININTMILRRVSDASRASGRSKNLIISTLMRRLADDHQKLVKSWIRVRYQDRDSGKCWDQLHLSLRPDEYEFFLDLRKAYKCSVSSLVSYAIEKYLDQMLNRILKYTDNYRYKNYMISRIIIDDVICWMYFWGIPRSLLDNPMKFITQYGLHIT